jgi:sporulation protein YabP
MEEATRKEHGLTLEGRRAGKITGVVDVVSFDPEMILLETSQGMLTIKGQELHVSRLYLEKGEVDVEGLFQSMVYSDDGNYARKQKGSLVKRLFK